MLDKLLSKVPFLSLKYKIVSDWLEGLIFLFSIEIMISVLTSSWTVFWLKELVQNFLSPCPFSDLVILIKWWEEYFVIPLDGIKRIVLIFSLECMVCLNWYVEDDCQNESLPNFEPLSVTYLQSCIESMEAYSIITLLRWVLCNRYGYISVVTYQEEGIFPLLIHISVLIFHAKESNISCGVRGSFPFCFLPLLTI